MSDLVEELTQIAIIDKNKPSATTFKVVIQPILDRGFQFSTLKSAARKLGMKFIQNDSKLIFESHDVKKTLSGLVAAMQK